MLSISQHGSAKRMLVLLPSVRPRGSSGLVGKMHVALTPGMPLWDARMGLPRGQEGALWWGGGGVGAVLCVGAGSGGRGRAGAMAGRGLCHRTLKV